MKIIKRKEWGAIKNKYPFTSHTPNKITVHNIGSSESPIINKFKGAESIRAIDNYHVNVRKWNAIGYHYIIAPNGDVYIGRPDNVVGAHVRNHNTGNIGINIYCNSNVEIPTDKQIDSLKELLRNLTNKYCIDSKSIYGHYELVATDCPGKNIKKMLPNIIKTFEIDTKKAIDTKVLNNNPEILKMLHTVATEINNINQKLIIITDMITKK